MQIPDSTELFGSVNLETVTDETIFFTASNSSRGDISGFFRATDEGISEVFTDELLLADGSGIARWCCGRRGPYPFKSYNADDLTVYTSYFDKTGQAATDDIG